MKKKHTYRVQTSTGELTRTTWRSYTHVVVRWSTVASEAQMLQKTIPHYSRWLRSSLHANQHRSLSETLTAMEKRLAILKAQPQDAEDADGMLNKGGVSEFCGSTALMHKAVMKWRAAGYRVEVFQVPPVEDPPSRRKWKNGDWVQPIDAPADAGYVLGDETPDGHVLFHPDRCIGTQANCNRYVRWDEIRFARKETEPR